MDGWNLIRFQLANKSTQGVPDPENITEWSIIGTTAAGTTAKIIFDRIMLQKFTPYYFQYYTNRAYVNGETGALWKETVETANADKINLDAEVGGILHYECCLLVQQSGSFMRAAQAETQGFATQLRRKYDAYWSTHPSDEEPLSYSKSPEIELDQDVDYGRLQTNEDFDT